MSSGNLCGLLSCLPFLLTLGVCNPSFMSCCIFSILFLRTRKKMPFCTQVFLYYQWKFYKEKIQICYEHIFFRPFCFLKTHTLKQKKVFHVFIIQLVILGKYFCSLFWIFYHCTSFNIFQCKANRHLHFLFVLFFLFD